MNLSSAAARIDEAADILRETNESAAAQGVAMVVRPASAAPRSTSDRAAVLASQEPYR